MKTIVIYHRADFDGIFCREIARQFFGDNAEYIGWDYGDAVPDIYKDAVPVDIELYMLDISVDGLMDHPNLIWIDHHKSAIEKYGSKICGYRIDGVAACRLTWQWFNCPMGPICNMQGIVDYSLPSKQDFIDRKIPEPFAVQLAGEYDIWDKRNPEAEIFQFGLRSIEITPSIWHDLLSLNKVLSVDEIEALIDVGHKDILAPDGTSKPPIIYTLLESGRILMDYQRGVDAGTMGRSFIMEFEGLKFLALNTARCNSLTFLSKDIPETGHDALMGFYWNGEKWTASLYHAKHRTDIDLSKIATKYGGGGHKGACGFKSDVLPFIPCHEKNSIQTSP